MLLLCCWWAAAMLLLCCCRAAAMLMVWCCYAAAMLPLCCCRSAAVVALRIICFIGFGLLYSTMPFRFELFNCILRHSLQLYSVSCWTSLSGVINGYIVHFSICRFTCYVYVSMCFRLRQIDLCYVHRLCCAFVGVLSLRRLCTDWHLPVCGGMKHRILILYYIAFIYALAYAIAPMRLLALSIDPLFYL